MGWKFWDRSKESEELRKIIDVSAQVAETKLQITEISEQMNKLARLQYKSGQDIQGRLERLNANVDTVMQLQAAREEADSRCLVMEGRIQAVTESLIRWLDDMDHALASQQSNWNQVMMQWSHQLVILLASFGIREIEVLGRSFDSRWAESVKAVSREELSVLNTHQQGLAKESYAPYEVLQVIKRGLIAENGQLIRKAQVITLQGDVVKHDEQE